MLLYKHVKYIKNFFKDIAMKRIILSIAVLGVLCLLDATVFADGGYSNITYVNQYYHGRYPGAAVGYYGGRAYLPPPPPPPAVMVYEMPTAQSTMFPNNRPWPIRQMRPAPYYYPRAGFYYSNPNVAIGVEY
jgi:hypothetical protein